MGLNPVYVEDNGIIISIPRDNNETSNEQIKHEMTDPKSTKPTIKELIVLNARGIKFEILMASLNCVPNSRLALVGDIISKPNKNELDLARLDELCDRYSDDFKEIFFNKDPHILSLIMKFYENDFISLGRKKHLSNFNFCAFELEADFEYWGIDHLEYLDSCCLRKFISNLSSLKADKKTEKKIIRELNFKEDFGKKFFPEVRRAIWMIMENQSNSTWAKVRILVLQSKVNFLNDLFSSDICRFLFNGHRIFNHSNSSSVDAYSQFGL
jgi:hypothetical protein